MNMCQVINAEISMRKRSGWKVFTRIKGVLKAKMDRSPRANRFNCIVWLDMLYAMVGWLVSYAYQTLCLI